MPLDAFFLSATLVAILGFLLFAALASALSFRFASVAPFAFWLASANSYPYFMRCPCAGRHLLFFAAAKKSRQKKAASNLRCRPG
jgi:hypothetical protein